MFTINYTTVFVITTTLFILSTSKNTHDWHWLHTTFHILHVSSWLNHHIYYVDIVFLVYLDAFGTYMYDYSCCSYDTRSENARDLLTAGAWLTTSSEIGKMVIARVVWAAAGSEAIRRNQTAILWTAAGEILQGKNLTLSDPYTQLFFAHPIL